MLAVFDGVRRYKNHPEYMFIVSARQCGRNFSCSAHCVVPSYVKLVPSDRFLDSATGDAMSAKTATHVTATYYRPCVLPYTDKMELLKISA